MRIISIRVIESLVIATLVLVGVAVGGDVVDGVVVENAADRLGETSDVMELAPLLEDSPDVIDGTGEGAGTLSFEGTLESIGTPLSETVERPLGDFLTHLQAVALANNPTVQQATAAVERARGLQFQSTRKLNPVVGYLASEIGNDGNAGQQGVFLSQEFVRGDKLELNGAIGSWEVQRLIWQLTAQEHRVRGAVALRYLALVGTLQQRDLVSRWNERLSSAVEASESLVEAGELGRGSLLQSQLELRRNRLTLIQLEQESDSQRRQLAALCGVDTTHMPTNVAYEPVGVTPLDRESTWQMLVAGHPLLSAAEARIDRSQWNIARQRAEPIPNLQSQFSLQYDDSTHDSVVGIQLGLPLPLHDQNRGNISAASAELAFACQERRRLELSLQSQFARVWQQYETAASQLDLIRDKLLPLADENLDITTEAYQEGESSYLAVLTAQRSLLDLLLQEVTTTRDLRQATATLDNLLLSDGLGQPADVEDALPSSTSQSGNGAPSLLLR